MTDASPYTPPSVWTWDKDSGGRFANINRPIAGPTHEKKLPRGKHPLQLYSLGTPNGVKVTILLEELLALGKSDAEYDAFLINIGQGDQFGSDFVDINPNSKIPALLDVSTSPPTRVFESGAILVYLAEKYGAFLPTQPAARAECMSWLFWQMGSAPDPWRRIWPLLCLCTREMGISNQPLHDGSETSSPTSSTATSPPADPSAEMNTTSLIWPMTTWYGVLVLTNMYGAREFLDTASYKNVIRWAQEIKERPAVKRGSRVNRTFGPEEDQVPERPTPATWIRLDQRLCVTGGR